VEPDRVVVSEGFLDVVVKTEVSTRRVTLKGWIGSLV
jgi:hypothetical protein